MNSFQLSELILLYSHKKFDDCVPQWPEIDEQHCDEVTQRHLKENKQRQEVFMSNISTTETLLLSYLHLYLIHVL